MKITQQTADVLVAKQGKTGGIIVGGISIVIGVGLGVLGLQQHPVLIFAAIFALVGVALILFSKDITLTINKSSQTVTRSAKGLVGAQNSQVIQFSQIQMVQVLNAYQRVTTNTGSSSTSGISIGTGNTATNYELKSDLILLLNDGQTMTIDSEQTPIGSGTISLTHPHIPAFGQQLAEFIGVPFQNDPPLSPMQGFQAGIHALQNIIKPGAPSVVAPQQSQPAPPLPIAPVPLVPPPAASIPAAPSEAAIPTTPSSATPPHTPSPESENTPTPGV